MESPTTPSDSARYVLRLVDIDPRRAAAEAERHLADAVRKRNFDDAAVLSRAAGLAALHVTDLDAATAHLRRAVRYAGRTPSATLLGESRMSLAAALMRQGEARSAIATINLAVDGLRGVHQARARAQRGALHHELGHLDDALADYRRALPALRRAADWVWVQRVLQNRAVLYIYRSQLSTAATDLREAENVCRDNELELQLAFVFDNLGFLHLRRGDVPAALRALDEAESRHRAVGAQAGTVLVDRAELLLSVRLVAEARANATSAVSEFAALRRHMALPQAQLLLAETALLDGDPEAATRAARAALNRFTRQRRAAWAALARYTVLQCRLAGPGASRVGFRAAAAIATELGAYGWTARAQDAFILAAKIALERGRLAEAEELLHGPAARRRRGPAEVRSRGWHAEALLHLAAGRTASARAALQAGIRVLDDYQLSLGAADLRTHVSGHRLGLVELGLRLAVESARPRRVLTWAEHGRATAMRLRPARPPQDRELAQLLVELRSVTLQADELRRAARPPDALLRKQVALERRIRERARFVPGWGGASPHLDVDDLADAVGGMALVEYLISDGRLLAVTLVDGRARLHDLGVVGDLDRLTSFLPFALRRLTTAAQRPAGRQRTESAARDLLERIGAELDQRLMRPIARTVADRPLVVVPTGCLQSVNWAVLPSCRGRAVTVAPSAALWQQASQISSHPGGTVAAAGPLLRVASPEAAAVAGLYDHAELLVGAEANAAAVMGALSRNRIAHIAAHGSFRSDNPLFSSLRLADGPLTVYDLQSLDRAPQLVVLAACDGGSSSVAVGDELLGLATGFLGLGTNVLVAPTGPVSDEDVAGLMVDLHRRLSAGLSVAQALAQVQLSAADASPQTVAAALSLTSFGAGHSVHGTRPRPARTVT